jgi:tetratricopeptide (TPR) repeat protein
MLRFETFSSCRGAAMAAGAPTSKTVWDHHSTVHTIQSTFNETLASRQGRVVLLASDSASGAGAVAHALAVRLAAHPANPLVVAGGFNSDGEWQPWLPPSRVRLARLQAGVDLAVKVLELSGTLGLPGAGAAAKLLGQLAAANAAVWTLLVKHAQCEQPLPGQTGPDAVRAGLRTAAGRHGGDGQPMVCVLNDLDRAATARDWWQGLVLRLAGELEDLPLLLVVALDGPRVLRGHQFGEPTRLWAARRLVEAGVGLWVPVARLDVNAVAAWLGASEPELAELMWEVTGGDPDWLWELWEHWQTTGAVRRNGLARWALTVEDKPRLGKVHDLLWERLERCYGGRLDDDRLERIVRVLAVGALEGQDFAPQFTAQAVALAVGRDADELIDELDDHLLASPDRPDGLLKEAGFAQPGDLHATSDNGETEGAWMCRYRFVSELHWRTLRRYGLLGRERQDGCRSLAAALIQLWQLEPEPAASEITMLLREAGDLQAAASWHVVAEFGAAVPAVEASARRLLAQDTTGWDRFDHAQAARQLEYAAMLLTNHRSVELVLRMAEGWAQAAQAAGWQVEHARALYHCGLLHEWRGNEDAAISCLRLARRIASRNGDVTVAAEAIAARAKVEAGQGRVRLAWRRAETARQLARDHRAFAAEAAALVVLTNLAMRSRDWKRAWTVAKAGVSAAERAGDHHGLVGLLRALGKTQEQLGQVGQARATLARALRVARNTGSRRGEGWSALELADLWGDDDPEAAEEHLLRGLAIARQLDIPGLGAGCHIRLAILARKRGEMRAALDALDQGTRLAQAASDLLILANIWAEWARLAEARGVPSGQVALVWASAALLYQQSGNAAGVAGLWEAAEQASAAAGTPCGREALAVRAQAALARDRGWGLLTEVFGSFHFDDPGGLHRLAGRPNRRPSQFRS